MELSDIFEDDDQLLSAIKIPTPIVDGDIARELREDFLEWIVSGKTEPPRAPGLHCSSLWKTCPRVPLLEKKYADYLKIRPETAGQRLTFDVGHALHHMMQNTYMGPFGRLWGQWKCMRCQSVVYEGLMPTACPRCDIPWRDQHDGTHNIIYAEQFVVDNDLKYCGHCDGIVLSRAGHKFVFEFKTISKSQYATLKSAKHEHVVQCHAYMAALGLRKAVILYLDKGSQADWKRLPDGTWRSLEPHVKVFLIEFSDSLWDSMVKRIREFHRAGVLAKNLPTVEIAHINQFPRVCTHKACDLAIECGAREFCFSI